ncbi:MAG: ferrous iron transporter B [Myxococcales bacterium]|nr:ferrous iron transporter B [Myxococcales bacterium]
MSETCGHGQGAGCAHCAIAQHRLTRLGIRSDEVDYVVVLAGNPNTGKSTVFNALTGLRQHTGNWPGKTVTRAEGGFDFSGKRYKLIDLPGTYSLLSHSPDEEIARNAIVFGQPDVTVVVVDATRLERNLNLALQVLEIADNAVICLNLMDEARRKGLVVDHRRLARDLGVPVVATSAREGEGLDELYQTIHLVATGEIVCRPFHVKRTHKLLNRAIQTIASGVTTLSPETPNAEWVAMRLLDDDGEIKAALRSGELAQMQRAYEAARTRGMNGSKRLPMAESNDGDARDAPGTARELTTGDTNPASAQSVEGKNGGQLSAPMHSERETDAPIIPPDSDAVDRLITAASTFRWQVGRDFHQRLVEATYAEAARLADRAVRLADDKPRFDLDRAIDRVVTSRIWGIPLMVALLAFVFWLTIAGANVPSELLANLLMDKLHPLLKQGGTALHFPAWLNGFLFDGVYLATAWVVSVMFPPMAIFFPLFTLLEDFGYLPRVAFNLDRTFKRVGAHGKQALTMTMGFGCNAAGVIATRIIHSPRERLIAIITNNFSLCNGRWPTQILIASIFVGGLVPAWLGGITAALAVVAVAVLGVGFTFLVSYGLSRTVLRGEVSTFSLELPPYRPPRILRTLYTSLIDRTFFVLWRAIVFAAPAGAVIWLLSNLRIGDLSIAHHLVSWMNPFGAMIGLSGIILLAYVVAIPANEIVVPTILMLIVLVRGVSGVGAGNGVMFELDSQVQTAELLRAGGFDLLMAVNLMLFSLVHNPCSTTIYTIYKETHSVKWTAVASLLPVGMGFVICFLVAQVWHLFV